MWWRRCTSPVVGSTAVPGAASGVVRAVHAALGRRLLVLLDGHGILLEAAPGARLQSCSSGAARQTRRAGRKAIGLPVAKPASIAAALASRRAQPPAGPSPGPRRRSAASAAKGLGAGASSGASASSPAAAAAAGQRSCRGTSGRARISSSSTSSRRSSARRQRQHVVFALVVQPRRPRPRRARSGSGGRPAAASVIGCRQRWHVSDTRGAAPAGAARSRPRRRPPAAARRAPTSAPAAPGRRLRRQRCSASRGMPASGHSPCSAPPSAAKAGHVQRRGVEAVASCGAVHVAAAGDDRGPV